MSARSLTTLGFVGFVALGLPEGATGVAWPSIAGDLDRDISRLGVVLVALVVGYFLASALTGRITRAVGIGRTLVASCVLSSLGLFGFAVAPVWPVLLIMAVVLGLGTALVDAGLNAHTALHGGPRVMHLLHASFGIGATLGPLVMTLFLVGPGSWRSGFVVFALVQVALAVAFLRTRDQWGSAHPPAARGADGGARFTGAVVTGLVLFAVYTGLEVAAGQWAYSVLTEDRGVTEGAAGFWVAGYWASLTLGRLVAGAVGDRVAPSRVITAGALASVAGAVAFWAAPGAALGGVGLVLIGFGLAPVFPTLVLLTPERVGPERSTAVVGYQLAAAAVGAAVLPGGVGVVVDLVGLDAVAPTLLGFALAMVAALEVTRRMPDAASAN